MKLNLKLSKQAFRITVFTTGFMITMTACGKNEEQSDKKLSQSENMVSTTETTASPDKKPIPLTVKQQVDFAVGDLAARMDMDPHEIVFSGMTPVMWRSGAVGCPDPGINYTQALVGGVLIMLRIENRAYRYHGTPGGEPFYCPDDQAEPPVPGQGAD